MEPNAKATWITVWFDDASAKCVYSSELVQELETAISVSRMYRIPLRCIDGTELIIRSSYIKGYYVSTPQSRELQRAWEKVIKPEVESSNDNDEPWR